MNTAEALEGMTGQAQFEVLATRVLRIEEEDCHRLEHLGVNAQGKTTRGPLDGFCLVPGTSPPRYVMAEHTTTSKAKLRQKWLFDYANQKSGKPNDDGDLIKAARQANEIRKEHPTASFVVYLCTNRSPSESLMRDVYTKGSQLGVEVTILAQSRIRDCLDMKPEGQWLRKEHLGIAAELLSHSLLEKLSLSSLERYAGEFLAIPETFVETSAAEALQSSVRTSSKLQIVLGESGAGKSTSCFQALKQYLVDGGLGLWIPGPVAAQAQSLEQAVQLVLQDLHPSIQSEAGLRALDLANSQGRLMLVIDDINQAPTSSELLRKIINWCRPAGDSGKGKGKDDCAPILLVPAWHAHWAPYDRDHEKSTWLSRARIGRMSNEEAVRCLEASLGKSHLIANEDASSVIHTLANDPILIVLFAKLYREDPSVSPTEIASNVMERFAESSLSDAAAAGEHIVADYQLVLSKLCGRMLGERELHPLWSEIRNWFTPEDVSALRELIQRHRICRVCEQGGEERFEFRHDRILGYYLVQTISTMLSGLGANQDVLNDPYYAEYVGQAIAMNLSEDVLEWACEHAQLALIASLNFAVPEAENGRRLVAAAKDWLCSAEKVSITPPSLLWIASRILQSMDSPLVLEVSEPLRRHPHFTRARLANGDATSGAFEFCSRSWFSPSVQDSGLEIVLRRGVGRCGVELTRGCRELLVGKGTDANLRRGALVLAGYIGIPGLLDAVNRAWMLADDELDYLVPALWAGLRCASGEVSSVLDQVMEVWSRLPDEDSKGLGLDRFEVADDLRFAFRDGVSAEAVKYLVSYAKSSDALRRPLTILLEQIDHPFAVRFIAEEAARIDRELEGTGRFSPWLVTLPDTWDLQILRGRQLSKDSIDELRACWDSETVSHELEKNAFRLWVRATDSLVDLRSIRSDHRQFSSALWRRAYLGDPLTVPEIVPLVATDDKWLRVIARVWSSEFHETVDESLQILAGRTPADFTDGRSNDHHSLAYLLRDIPIAVAEQLLCRHWGHLKYSSLFVQCALYLGTLNCLSLARDAVDNYPPGSGPFKHVASFFGFNTVGLRDKISRRHLDSLVPYLGQLDVHTLSSMVDFCIRSGFRDWAQYHVFSELESRLRDTSPGKEEREDLARVALHHFPTDVNLLNKLDQIEAQGGYIYGSLFTWMEGFRLRQDHENRWRLLLEEWLQASPTYERLQVVAEVVQSHGTRRDLAILDGDEIGNGHEGIGLTRENAKLAVMRRSPK